MPSSTSGMPGTYDRSADASPPVEVSAADARSPISGAGARAHATRLAASSLARFCAPGGTRKMGENWAKRGRARQMGEVHGRRGGREGLLAGGGGKLHGMRRGRLGRMAGKRTWQW
eukprot:359013-Chlamydomonas_euryale.AAC.8